MLCLLRGSVAAAEAQDLRPSLSGDAEPRRQPAQGDLSPHALRRSFAVLPSADDVPLRPMRPGSAQPGLFDLTEVAPPKPAAPPATAARPAKSEDAAPQAPDPAQFVYVTDQDLRSFLGDFARRLGLRSDIATNIRGRLTRVKLPAEAPALLRELEQRFEIEWVIEDQYLKVTSRAQLATRILPLAEIEYDALIREMKAAGIDATRYPVRKMNGSNAVIVTAPAAQVGRIAALIDAMKAGRGLGSDVRLIRFGVPNKANLD